MSEIYGQYNAGSETPPKWDIELQPGAEGITPALLIVGETGTVTIPLDEVNEFYNELMAAASRLAAIEAEAQDD